MNETVNKIRSILIKVLLGCLVAAASVAVVAVLIGEMNDITWRLLMTVFSGMIHIGILLSVVSIAAAGSKRAVQSTNLVINSAMVIATLSFFTSYFGIWEVIDGEVALKLYSTYAIVMFAILRIKTLIDLGEIYTKARPYIYANYAFIALVVGLLLGAIYAPSELSILDGFYGRLLAAAAIIDATLSMAIAVMYKLYLQKHPELAAQQSATNRHATGRIITAALLFIFVVAIFMWGLY